MTSSPAPAAADRYTVTITDKAFDAPVVAHYSDLLRAGAALRACSAYQGFVKGAVNRIATGEVMSRAKRAKAGVTFSAPTPLALTR